MRIDSLDLIAVGPFTNRSLDLSQGAQGLHLICGPNEAGKSSALRALRDGLFGFPHSTNDNFLHSNRDLRIGMTLRDSRGQRIEFVRRKGNKGTLLNPQTNQPLPDNLLEEWLGHVSRELFTKMYGLGYQDLQSGGAEILETSSEIGQLLFSAAGATGNVRQALKMLEDKANELFKPNAPTTAINVSIRQWNEGKKELISISTPSQKAQELQVRISSLHNEVTQGETKLQDLRRSARHFEMLKRLRVPLRRRSELVQEQAALGEVQRLSRNFETSRQTAMGERDKAQTLLNRTQQRIQELADAINQLPTPHPLLNRIEDVQNLLGRSSRYLSATSDLPSIQNKARQLRESIAKEIESIRPGLSLEEAHRNKLSPSLRRQLLPLTEQQSKSDAERETIEQAIRDLEHSLGDLEQAIEERNELTIPEVLADLLDSMTGLEIQEQQERDSRSNLAQRLERWQRQVVALWNKPLVAEEVSEFPQVREVSAEVFGRRRVPTIAQWEDYHESHGKLSGELDRLDQQLKALKERRNDWLVTQETLLAQVGPLPSQEQLERSRQHRDQVWQVFKQKWEQGEATEAELLEAKRIVTTESLTEGYEQLVREADSIGDRLWRDAKSVAERARCEVELTSLAQQQMALEQEQAACNARLKELGVHWLSLWEEARSNWLSPKEAKSWIDEYRKLAEEWEQIDVARGEAERLSANLLASAEQLRSVVKRMGDWEVEAEELGAAVLWKSLKREMARRLEWNAERARLLKERQKRQSELLRLQGDLKRVVERHDEWQVAWKKFVIELGLPENASTSRADAVLTQLSSLESRLDELLNEEGLEERIAQMKAERERFHAELEPLAQLAGIKFTHEQAMEGLNELNQLLEEAKLTKSRREGLLKQQAELERDREQLEEQVAKAEATLKRLCSDAGCTQEAELADAWLRFQKLEEIEGKTRENWEQIQELLDDADLDQIEAELAGYSSDELEGLMDRASREADELESRLATSREQLGAIRQQYAGIGSGNEAISQVAQLARIRAQVDHDAQLWGRYKLASVLLSKAIDRFQDRHQGPMLHLAGQRFSQLTCGSFSGLAIDYVDRKPTLVGTRGNELVPVSGMSSGTADQLFLALRLAYLESRFEQGEPMPLLIDDLLMAFDDRRSAAAIKVLAGFSLKTQIVIFTHHEHLLDLAQKALSEQGQGECLFTYRL